MNPVLSKDTVRPATIGELRQKLAEGIPCEVAAHAAESAKLRLSILGFTAFKILGPINGGWVCFAP